MNESGYPEPLSPAYRPPNPLVKVNTPYVTYIILGITIAVYVLQIVSRLLLGNDYLILLGGKINDFIILGQVWRFITPVFLHDSTLPFGLLHIGVNMYSLFVIGPNLERAYGHRRFTLLYFLSGYAGNVLSFLLHPAGYSVGASTALFGLIASEFVLLYRNKNYIVNARGMLNQVITVVLVNFGVGMAANFIDNWGHLGGFLGGIGFGWFAGPLLAFDKTGYYLIDSHKIRNEIIATALVFITFSLLSAIAFFG